LQQDMLAKVKPKLQRNHMKAAPGGKSWLQHCGS
jgi:hypothetical protein